MAASLSSGWTGFLQAALDGLRFEGLRLGVFFLAFGMTEAFNSRLEVEQH